MPFSSQRRDSINVLLIEDSVTDVVLVKGLLDSCSDPSFTLYHETTCKAGVQRLSTTQIDIVVLDLTLPDSHGLDTFLAFRSVAAEIPVVILSSLSDEQVALEAVREGAQNFFAKSEVMSASLGRLLQYAIERFHRQVAEREIASAGYVQSRLFPNELPAIPGYDIAGRCEPTNHVGGDYFDYLMVDDSTMMVVIADVSGHGLGPALVMAETRAALRTMAATTDDVGAMVYQANELVHDDQVSWFVTLFVARIDTRTGACLYVSAGHPAEIFKPDGTRIDLVSEDPPIGIRLGTLFAVHRTWLEQGDTLLMYTDGLSERTGIGDEFFGVDRIRGSIVSSRGCSAQETIDRLFDSANRFAEQIHPADDMTALVLKLGPMVGSGQ